jgi:peptide/nickel transport system ATP-binding protein
MSGSIEPAPLLSVRRLSISITGDEGVRQVLHDVSFDLHRGEILALVGESGSGKSLCAQAIINLLPKPAVFISDGEVVLDGIRIDNSGAQFLQKIRGKRIAMIFQEPTAALNPVQTIGQQMAEVFNVHFPEMDAAKIVERSLELLHAVNVTEAEQRLHSYPHQLSGGLCQRVMIAMALAGEPDILIADEPSTALDANTQKQLLTLLHDLQQKMNMSVLFITHDLALVSHWCQRVAVLQHGLLCEIADTQQLFSTPQHPYTQSLLAAISAGQIKTTDTLLNPVLLSVRHINKFFQLPQALLARKKSPQQILHDVSFDIHQQEVLALVGESGCGKSTLGRALLFLDPPDSGEITYAGMTLQACDDRAVRALRCDLQVIFQDTNESLNPRHTVAKILREPLDIYAVGSAAERELRIRELLRIVELPEESLSRFPHEFSGGQRQRIGIARAIALKPKLIVCDEAVSALDVSTQAQIIALLLKLQAELKLSLLFITHDLSVVRKVADRVLVMQAGRIVETGNTEQIFNNPQHAATKLLLSSTHVMPSKYSGGD